MQPANENAIRQRVLTAANEALAKKKFVSAVDVLLGMGWLSPADEATWRQGRVDCLEGVVHANLPKVSLAMKFFRLWAKERGLRPSPTAYVARTSDRRTLRFSRSGDGRIEEAYRTHWVSAELSEKKQQLIQERMNKPPGLVVIIPLNDDWKCTRCGGTGDLLMMQDDGPKCLVCVKLDHLVYLPSGNAKLTRRAKAESPESTVVVRFSRARKRYERQGILAQKDVIERVKAELSLGDED